MWHEQPLDSIEAVKSEIKRIRRAGTHAEILGWVLILTAPTIIWVAGKKSVVFALLCIFFLSGTYFVLTGAYIRAGFGRRVKIALLANSIVAFVLCLGILPIYVSVQSSNSRDRIKKLPDKIQELYNKRRPLRLGLLEIILLICAVIGASTSTYLKVHRLAVSTHGVSTPGPQAPKVDTATKSHFTITFPTTVHAADFTETVSGHTATYATYKSVAKKSAGDFYVYAYNFPSPYFKYDTMGDAALTASLKKSVVSIVQGLQGTLVNSNPSTYDGKISEEATFSSQTYGGTRAGYMRAFFIGNGEYCIFTIGTSQDDFQSFAGSFQAVGI